MKFVFRISKFHFYFKGRTHRSQYISFLAMGRGYMTDTDETDSEEKRKSSDSSRGFDFLSRTAVKVAADPKYSLKDNPI